MGYTVLPAKNFEPILPLDLKRDQSRGQIMAKEDIVTLKRKIHIHVFIQNLGKPVELSPIGSQGASQTEATSGHRIWFALALMSRSLMCLGSISLLSASNGSLKHRFFTMRALKSLRMTSAFPFVNGPNNISNSKLKL